MAEQVKKEQFVLCINGDREINDYQILLAAIDWFGIKVEDVKEVLCGDAKGADALGERWAKENGIPVKHYPAKWNDLNVEGAVVKNNKFGKPYNTRAGFMRNDDMAHDGNRILSLQTNGITSGTDDCAEKFKKYGKIVYSFSNKEYNNYLRKDNPDIASDEIPF